MFSCQVAREFVIIPLHTTPETSVREIDELYDVYLDVKRLWKTEVSHYYSGMFALLNESLKSTLVRAQKALEVIPPAQGRRSDFL